MRAAIIGMGVIGPVHLNVLSELGIEICAVCDIRTEHAKRVLTDKGISAPVYADLKAMLDEQAPDAVHICTPHYLHAEEVIECLGRGINVLCEKPLCISYEQLSKIHEAKRESGASFGLCLQNRYNPTNVFAKEFLREHRAISANAHVVWHRDEGYYNSAEWRGKKDTEGGGVLINQALHTLDLVAWLCGVPTALSAHTENMSLRGIIEVEDTAVIRAEGEVPFTFFATVGSRSDYPVVIEIMLEGGRVLTVLPKTVLLDGHEIFSECDAEAIKRIYGKPCYGTGHSALIADYYDCLGSGRYFDVDLCEGETLQKIILAAYRSRGERVEVDVCK